MLPLLPIALACLLQAGPAAAAQAAPVSIPAIAQSADAGMDSSESDPGRQTTPGPEDEGYGPRMPRGEEAGSNAAIGSTLQGVYTFISVAGLVMLLLFAVSD